MSLITIALEKPTNLTTASKYTVLNGFIYFGLGVALILWPGAIQTLFRERAFLGDEQGLFRALGMAVALIGYYLVIGGRAGSRQATAASVIDRLTIAPLVLLPLAIAGVFPRFLITVVIVDFCLASSTWALLRAETTPPSFRPASGAV
jgi:threonine/homoserine efflux transporter RhtA